MSKILKATHGSDKTPLVLGNDIEIPCYVLNDGSRVLSQSGMIKALGMTYGSSNKEGGADRLTNFVTQTRFNDLISKDIIDLITSPIKFQTPTGGSASGYEATILVDICDAIIQANKEGKLMKQQQHIADQAEILIRAFAKTGIVALVDEATGYQYDREADALQKILKAYISEELLPWQKRFPDVFYKELFRLNDWDFTVKGIKKRPGVIGKWTNTLIYEQLPPGVLEELKEKTPKNVQRHRMLTLDVGEPNLSAQIQQIITLFQLSDDMKHMWQQFEKLKHRQSGQLELPFEFDEKGHTIAPEEPDQKKDEQLSKFNKNLKKAIDHNPKK